MLVEYRHTSKVINFDSNGFALKPIPRRWIRLEGLCVSKFDFRIGIARFIPGLSFPTRGLSQSRRKWEIEDAKRILLSCMRTTQCRLCLANIPHDYDHSLEFISLEKEDSIKVDEIAEPLQQRQRHSSSNWPDSAAIATLLFILFALNAAVFITWLVLRDLFSCDSCHRMMRTALSSSIAGGCAITNFCFVLVGRRKFRSRIICGSSFTAGSFWCGVIVETIRSI